MRRFIGIALTVLLLAGGFAVLALSDVTSYLSSRTSSLNDEDPAAIPPLDSLDPEPAKLNPKPTRPLPNASLDTPGASKCFVFNGESFCEATDRVPMAEPALPEQPSPSTGESKCFTFNGESFCENADPLPVPDATPPTPERSPLQAARALAQQTAETVDVAIEMDTPMAVQQTYEVTFVMQAREPGQSMSPARGFGQALHDIPAATLMTDKTTVAGPVEAILLSSDFDITPLQVGLKAVVPKVETIWKWQVQPKSTGTKAMTFVLEQTITVDGTPMVMTVQNYPRTVEVQVVQGLGLVAAWQWATGDWLSLAAILAALLGLGTVVIVLVRRLGPRRRQTP